MDELSVRVVSLCGNVLFVLSGSSETSVVVVCVSQFKVTSMPSYTDSIETSSIRLCANLASLKTMPASMPSENCEGSPGLSSEQIKPMMASGCNDSPVFSSYVCGYSGPSR